ncbi:G-protein coupled receptor [Branchiostoma belcheri]|nr:G-protein coupled receptor [Branchiostoma belcheri]
MAGLAIEEVKLLMSLVIVVFVNVRIFIELKRRLSRTRPPENSRDDLPAARRREQRVAARQYRQLRNTWREDCERKARPYWGFLIALCYSVVNLIIYALRIKKIREAIVAVGDALVMGAVTGPSTDSRTDPPPNWAASRRPNPINGLN